MRDPNRIYPFCMKLAELWLNNYPDWRFGQFVSNILGRDPFYIEDDKALLEMERYFNVKAGDTDDDS